jgi:hypothetical protein
MTSIAAIDLIARRPAWRLIPVEIGAAARAPRVLEPGLGRPELKISLLQCSPNTSHRQLSHALGVSRQEIAIKLQTPGVREPLGARWAPVRRLRRH